jgi:hypothetical protein
MAVLPACSVGPGHAAIIVAPRTVLSRGDGRYFVCTVTERPMVPTKKALLLFFGTFVSCQAMAVANETLEEAWNGHFR